MDENKWKTVGKYIPLENDNKQKGIKILGYINQR